MRDSFRSEEEIDRREIYRKLHRQRSQKLRESGVGSDIVEDDHVLLEPYEDDASESYREYGDGDDDESGYPEEEVGEEDYEAMNQALSSPPVAWWQMRKQWQNKPNVAKLLGRRSSMEEDEVDDIDNSYRMGNLTATAAMDGGVVGHPVMLADPQSMGYDGGAFRQNPFAEDKNKKNKVHRNMIMYVPKSVVHKRRCHQLAYIAGTVCAVMLFVFFLEQRKLSNYALVDSPMSLSAYLVGEQMDPKDQVSVQSIQLVPVPKAKRTSAYEENLVKGGEEFARSVDISSSTVEMHVSKRYKSLRSLFVSQGITPDEAFDNPVSPQAQALHWMAYQDLHPGLFLGYGHDEYAAKKIIQRYSLAVTYYATNGPGWYNQVNFLSNKDECEWNEITKVEQYFIGAGDCDDEGFVTALALWSNNLMGALPQELGTLSTLTTLSLYDNNMRGPPPRILQALSGLKILYLNQNQFIGSLDFMCGLNIETMKADCGEKGGVTCSCCTECGWNKNQEKPLRLEHGRNP